MKLFNHMASLIADPPGGDPKALEMDAVFTLGGFSWKEQRFVIWRLEYNQAVSRFRFRKANPWKGADLSKVVMFSGDHAWKAKNDLVELLKQRGKLKSDGFDMEPFEVLRDMARNEKYPSIGGPPQVLKIYRHMNVYPYAVFWPNRESRKLSFLGRPMMEHETSLQFALDPDTLEVLRLWSYDTSKKGLGNEYAREQG